MLRLNYRSAVRVVVLLVCRMLAGFRGNEGVSQRLLDNLLVIARVRGPTSRTPLDSPGLCVARSTDSKIEPPFLLPKIEFLPSNPRFQHIVYMTIQSIIVRKVRTRDGFREEVDVAEFWLHISAR